MSSAQGTSGLLAGRVAVLTGASKGIGVAIASRLVDEGASVALLARNLAALRQVADSLGRSALPLQCDVSDPRSVRETFDRIGERFAAVDVLVNNAGTIGMSLLEQADDEHITGIVGTNLVGPMLCARAAIPLLRVAGGGHIINISSRSVELARPYLSVYSASKGGLETFSRTLAAELRPERISVSSIRVGPTDSAPTVDVTGAGQKGVTEDWVARGGPAPEAPAPPESVADAVVYVATARPGTRVPVVYLEPR